MSNIKYLWKLFICHICKYIPKKKNRIVFGSWFSERYSDNSKYLFQYMYKEYGTKFEYVWVLKNPDLFPSDYKNVVVVKRGSFKAFRYLVTSNVSVMTHGYRDFSEYNFVRGSLMVMLWHGVAWKKIAYDTRNINRDGLRHKLIKSLEQCDFYIAPSLEYKKNLKTAFDITDEKIILTGQPRNAIFYDLKGIEQITKNINDYLYDKFKVDVRDGVLVTYMPTFRDDYIKQDTFLTGDEIREIEEKTGKNIYVINKNHFVDKGYVYNDYHIFQVDEIDTQELLAATDLLISDYSSCMFDYILLNRPIIQYIYDYQFYQNENRGLYYTIDQVTCGSKPVNHKELYDALIENINDVNYMESQRAIAKKQFACYESSESCGIIVKHILNKLDIS